MPKAPSDNRITRERHRQVTNGTGICPGCWDHLIVTVNRREEVTDPVTGRTRTKFGGSYLACGGHGHSCWSMTKNPDAKLLYETHGPLSKNRKLAAE